VNESFEVIYNQLSVNNDSTISDEQMLGIISDRVAWFLQNDKDLLLSYLYRLDIDESKIDMALSPADENPAHVAIGKLILTRQKQRFESKTKYKVEPIQGWEF